MLTPQPRAGRVVEWFKALVLKTRDAQASVGSNPTPSANKNSRLAVHRILSDAA